MAIITAAEYRTYAGLADDDAPTNAVITAAITRYQSLVEGYCDRELEEADYTDTVYDFDQRELLLRNWPVIEVASVTVDGEAAAVADLQVKLDEGVIRNSEAEITGDLVVVEYTAGYEEMPPEIKAVMLTLVDGFLRGESGGVNALRTVRRETVYGVSSIDYEGVRNDQLFGAPYAELGPYVSVLAKYRRLEVL
jgi:hypothetical protein